LYNSARRRNYNGPIRQKYLQRVTELGELPAGSIRPFPILSAAPVSGPARTVLCLPRCARHPFFGVSSLSSPDHRWPRFLSAPDPINNVFCLRRGHVTAAEHRASTAQIFQIWPAPAAPVPQVDGASGATSRGTLLLHVAPCKYARQGEPVIVTTHAQLPCEPRLGSIRALPPCPPGSR
jgi:hypothetical protein